MVKWAEGTIDLLAQRCRAIHCELIQLIMFAVVIALSIATAFASGEKYTLVGRGCCSSVSQGGKFTDVVKGVMFSDHKGYNASRCADLCSADTACIAYGHHSTPKSKSECILYGTSDFGYIRESVKTDPEGNRIGTFIDWTWREFSGQRVKGAFVDKDNANGEHSGTNPGCLTDSWACYAKSSGHAQSLSSVHGCETVLSGAGSKKSDWQTLLSCADEEVSVKYSKTDAYRIEAVSLKKGGNSEKFGTKGLVAPRSASICGAQLLFSNYWGGIEIEQSKTGVKDAKGLLSHRDCLN